MSSSEIRVVVQEVNGVLVVPIQDPVQDRFLEEMRVQLLAILQRRAPLPSSSICRAWKSSDACDFETIRRVSQALELMGARVVLAGIRPGVAAGLVSLDVDDGWVRATLSVEQALAAVR